MKSAVVLGGAAVIVLWIGVGGFFTPAAHASGDRRENRLNGDTNDQSQDRLSGGDSSESSDASSPSNDSSSSNTNSNAAAKVAKVGGHWSGGITDNSLGAGTLDLFIAQSGKSLSGGFDTSFSGGSEDFTGSLSGKANSTGATGKLRPNGGGKCRVAFTGKLASADEIKGTYTSSKCSGTTTGGTFDVLFEHK
jgi:hypothetical protein